MKTRTTSSMLIPLLLALFTLGASNAQAITLTGPPVGIALGQTARVNVLNISDGAIIITGVKFLDEEGDLLGEFRERTVEPGKTMSFDLNRDDLIREGNRIQIHAVIGIPERHRRDVVISLEVFDNEDGKTTVAPGNKLWLATVMPGGYYNPPVPVGIAIGQTARVNALNFSDRAVMITAVKFLDEEGNLLAEFRQRTIEPGKTISLDLNRDDLIREESRIQIHAVIDFQRSTPEVAIILEVFDNDTGKTTIYDAIVIGSGFGT